MNNGENNNLVQSTEVPTNPVQQTVQTVQQQSAQPVQNPSVEEPKQKKKMDKKTIIRLGAVGVILLAVAVYFIFFHEWTIKEKSTDPKSVSYVYINSIIEKDFSHAFKYAYLPNDSFVDEDDYFVYASNNKKYNDLYNKKIVSVNKISSTPVTAEYEVILDDESKYNLNLSMDSDNNWHIIVDNLYIENWKVEVPGSSKLYINNALVDKSLTKKSEDHDIYTIPAIAPSKKEFKIVTEFDTYTKSLEVAGSNSGEKMIPELNKEDEINSALEYLKGTWNNIYKDYMNSKPKEEVLSSYFDTSFTLDDIDKYYAKSFDSLTRKSNKSSTNTDIELVEIKNNTNNKSYIEGNNVIRLEFGYKVSFIVDFVYSGSKDWNEYMTRYSSIELIKENGKYKIHKITDEKLLNYLNYSIKEY